VNKKEKREKEEVGMKKEFKQTCAPEESMETRFNV